MFLCVGSAIQLRDGERIDVELSDLVTSAYQPDELMFRGGKRCIRHHVQQADVQLANILVTCTISCQHILTALAKPLKCRQIIVCNDRHVFVRPRLP
jgi:hypothetical protein